MTWEFGAGLGHLNRMLPVAARLRETGHELVLAVPSPDAARQLIAAGLGLSAPPDRLPAVRVTASPHWPGPTDPAARKVPTHTLADVLKLFGYHDIERLSAMAERWDQLVGEIRPDLIVADFCPTLSLALAERLPLVCLGNGYTVPPPDRLLPPIRPWERAPPPFSRANESMLLRAINGVRARRGNRSVEFFADLFSGQRTFICTIPEFDPYAAFRDSPTLVPFNIALLAPGPPAASRTADHVFVYLPNNHPLLTATFAAISSLKLQADVYVKDPPRGLASGDRMRLHAQPLDLADILPRIRLIVHHAGLATAYAAAMAGTPQFALPLNLEHAVTARGLARLCGAATRQATVPATPDELGRQIAALLVAPALHGAADQAARVLALRPRGDGVSDVVKGCAALLTSGVS